MSSMAQTFVEQLNARVKDQKAWQPQQVAARVQGTGIGKLNVEHEAGETDWFVHFQDGSCAGYKNRPNYQVWKVRD